MNLSNKTKGILCIMASALGFSLMTAFVKYSGDLPSVQKMFFRNIIACGVSAAILVRQRVKIKTSLLHLYTIRSILGTAGMICTFYSIDRLLLADASMLFKLAPFFTVLMSFFLLQERISFIRILIIIGAFIGSLFILNPSINSFTVSLPSIIAVISAFFAGTAYTFVRKLGQQGAEGVSIVFFFSAFSTLVAIPLFALNFEPMTLRQVFLLCMAGLSATLGQFGVTKAYMYAPAKEISVFDYTQVVFSALLGFFLYAEIPTVYSFIGYAVIISMGVISFFYGKDENKEKKNKKN